MNAHNANLHWILNQQPSQTSRRAPETPGEAQPADEELLAAYSRAVVGVAEMV